MKAVGQASPVRSQANARQVARRLGISQMTVSRAFSGKGAVSGLTRQRIFEMADQIGYRPNPLAAGLRGAATRSIGVVWPLHAPWAIETGRRLYQQIRQRGYAVYQANVAAVGEAMGSVLRDWTDRRVDGLVFWSDPHCSMTQELDGISAFSAVVAVGPEDDPRFRGDLLMLNSYRALEAIVDHLAATGRRRPAIVLTAWNGVRPKEEVFLARCRRHGMQVDAGSVIDLRMVEYSGLAQAYREALEARFAGGVDVDAVVCGVDVGAMATIRFLEERGLQVPVDVAVIGANDSTEAALYRPALASVDRRPAEVAQCIEEMVFGRLERPQAPPVRRRIDMRFVWRESAGGENCESGVER